MKRGGTRSKVYVVVEPNDNYDPAIKLYPDLYYSYEAARDAVITNYASELEEEREEGGDMASDVDVKENETDGKTKLYIEKGINIIIQRYMLDR